MPLTTPENTAVTNLGLYNANRYDVSTNPKGLGGEGYKPNGPAAWNDTATATNAVARLAGEVAADEATVTAAVATVIAARDATIAAAAGAGVTDGDKGDITVSSAGTVWRLSPAEIGGIIYAQVIVDGVVAKPFIAPFAMTINTIKLIVKTGSVDARFLDESDNPYFFGSASPAESWISVTTTEATATPDTPISLSKYEIMKLEFNNNSSAENFIAIFEGVRVYA